MPKLWCNKRKYRKKEAQNMRNLRRGDGHLLRIYRCEICNFWHLTGKDMRGERYK